MYANWRLVGWVGAAVCRVPDLFFVGVLLLAQFIGHKGAMRRPRLLRSTACTAFGKDR